jgi:hypothetical protein
MMVVVVMLLVMLKASKSKSLVMTFSEVGNSLKDISEKGGDNVFLFEIQILGTTKVEAAGASLHLLLLC